MCHWASGEKIMEVRYCFSILSLDSLLGILQKRHQSHARQQPAPAQFELRIEPGGWGPDRILFQTCDTLDELLLVISFILKHKLQVTGSLVATFYR